MIMKFIFYLLLFISLLTFTIFVFNYPLKTMANINEKNLPNNPEGKLANKLVRSTNYKPCPTPFRVSVLDYPNESLDLWPEAKFMHNWLLQSNYFTNEKALACLEVHLAFGRQTSEYFLELENEGRNQLVIFIGAGITPIRNHGNRHAIFVASQFGHGYIRTGLDFHLVTDVFDFDSKLWENLPMVDGKRPELISCSFLSENFAEMLSFCKNKTEVTPSKAQLTFLILNNQTLAKLPSHIHKILLAGSVPFLLGGPNPMAPKSPLPFAHWIRWERALIWLPWARKHEIDAILKGIAPGQLTRMRRFGRFILEHHIGNAKVLVRSILSDIRMKLGIPAPPEQTVHLPFLHIFESNKESQMHQSSNFFESNQQSSITFENAEYLWNENPSYLDAAPVFPLKRPLNNLWNFLDENNEKFTIVMQAFRRDAKLAFSLKRLDGMPHLDRILVIWNEIGRFPPAAIFPQIHVPIFVLNGTRNSMNNRFLPFSQIRTEAVLIMDDDLDIGENFQQKVLFMFKVWQQNRLRIVGPIFRLALKHYMGAPQCSFNLVLSDIAFLNRIYFRAYSREMSPAIRAYIDAEINCDDIAVNFLVAHLTGQGPIKTHNIRNIKELKIPGESAVQPMEHKGLSARKNHYEVRSDCVRLFTRIFGYNPNMVSIYRVDPLWDNETRPKCV